jgi:hypothetical protein
LIDIVKDQLYGSDYVKDEDPTTFVSEKTSRGPLGETWIEDSCKSSEAIMCAYKLCTVEFKYWGMQTKIERFIHDTALRRVMLRAHRQAWAWQDEWFGLTMADIRELEDQTQAILAKKMAIEADDTGSASEATKLPSPTKEPHSESNSNAVEDRKPGNDTALSSPSSESMKSCD